MKVKEESEKVGLKLKIQKMKIMASGPITSQWWGNSGNSEGVFLVGGFKSLHMVTTTMRLKMIVPWKKSYDQAGQHIKKQRHYLANKGPSSQRFGFSSSHVWMSELDNKEAECQRIGAFELWCWRGLLRVCWTARRSNQSILKEYNLECTLEGLMLKLKLQFFGHLMWTTDLLEETLLLERMKAGGEGNDRGWDGWIASPTQWTWV